MQEDIGSFMQVASVLVMTAALFSAIFGVSLQCIDFLDNYQQKITTLSNVQAVSDINSLARHNKSFAVIYKIAQTYPTYVNSVICDFTDIADYTGDDYVCYKLISTDLIDSNTIKAAVKECGFEGAGFVNIDNMSSEDALYGTGDNIVSIGHGSGYIRFQCSVYRCIDGHTFDIYAKAIYGLN